MGISRMCLFLKQDRVLKLKSPITFTRVLEVYCLFVLERCWKLQGNSLNYGVETDNLRAILALNISRYLRY